MGSLLLFMIIVQFSCFHRVRAIADSQALRLLARFLNKSDYRMEFQMERAYLLEHFQDYRIIQPQVVFIHGLPTILSHPQTLQRQLAHLGHILRISVQYLSKDFYSAFAEFHTHVTPAILILMLNELSLHNRTLRVFYGSTKFCPHYLRNHQCQLSSCNYAHYYVPHLTHLRDQAKQIDHNAIAYIHLYQNIPLALAEIQRINSQKIDSSLILPLTSHKLQRLFDELSQHMQPQPEIYEAPEKIEEWSDLEKEICEETLSQSQQVKLQDGKGQSRVQQFLDSAQRFLTKLIFQSSMFVY